MFHKINFSHFNIVGFSSYSNTSFLIAIYVVTDANQATVF